MNTELIDWNCDLLSLIRIDLAESELKVVEVMRFMMETHGITRFCMMPLFDARKEPVSVFQLKRVAYEERLQPVLPKSLSVKYSSKVLLVRGLSDLPDLARLTDATNGYLPLMLPLTAFEDWMDEELNRLLYKRKIKLLLLSCELFPILYSPGTVEKLLRIQGAMYQFGYHALSDGKLNRMIYNMYSLKRPILFGTGIDCLQKAWNYPISDFRNWSTSLFSKPEFQRMDHQAKLFWNA